MSERAMRKDGERTRAALLKAAAEEFAEHGFAGASTRAICAKAGANNALLNRYFRTKEEIYRRVAEHFFGDLGAPVAALADNVRSAESWRRAMTEWIDDMLFMTIPGAYEQEICASLFRHEVTLPTRFHEEFKRKFGEPVFTALKRLLAMALDNEDDVDLWSSSIWAQVTIYALASPVWQPDFRPDRVGPEEWRGKVRDHICESVFSKMKFR